MVALRLTLVQVFFQAAKDLEKLNLEMDALQKQEEEWKKKEEELTKKEKVTVVFMLCEIYLVLL